MKVLVVEDDLGVAQSLQHLLSHYHYAVDIATDAEAGLQMVEVFAYDLAILDIALPGMDGLDLCQQLREQGLQMPVLLLTGQDCKGPQKAAALNVGADDYVLKPFDAAELMARVQALLRRHGMNAQPILTWGALSVDPSSRRVTYGAQLLSLTPKEYAILELLLRNAQVTLSAAEIIDRVWDSADAPGEEVVRYHIKELRQKLKAVGAPKTFIQTVHGVGYRVNPIFSDCLANQVEQQPNLPQVAELTSVNEQLRTTLEELQMASETLRVQNEELQATRRELEQERQRYQDLFELAPDGYLVTDRSGRIQAANQAAVTMLGLTARELTNQPLENFIHLTDRRSFCAYLKQHRWPQNWEVMIHAAQQESLPVLISVTLMLDEQQQVTGLRWLLRDICDRKRMEQQLQAARDELEQRVIERTATLHQREAFLSSIYHGAAQPIFVVDVTAAGDFRYVDFNRAALEISGLSLDEIQNQTPEAAFGDSVGGQFRQNYQRCVDADSSITYEERFTLDQRDVWTMTTLSPMRDQGGRIHRLVGTVFDISDRKRAEQALQHSEAQARLAIQVGQLGTWQYDPRTEWVVLDERMREIWGESAETTTLPLSTMMERIHPDDREQVAIAIQAALDPASSGQYAVECRIVWADGTEHWILVNGLVQFQGEGAARQPHNFFGTILDVTDRKQSEITLKRQIRQEYLLSDIAQDIRRSLNLDEVLSRTVQRVREFLNCDRVIIFRFRPDWQGDVIMESVGPEWIHLLGTTIDDPCFEDRYIEPYRQGHISTLTDLEEAHVEPCYRELLQSFQVRASLAVPILQNHQLWGLLIAHQCAAPRQWQPVEIALLRRLAIQVSIAIQQSELYERTRHELMAREQMQTVLEDSEERFRTLSAAAPVGILQANADGICLYANPHWQIISGLTSQDSLGTGWQQAIHSDDRAAVLADWDNYLQHHDHCRREFRLLTPQNETRWVAARAAPLQSASGEIIGNVCIFADITEQKQAMQKIEEQAALLDIAPDAIFMCDLDHHILYWNRGAEQLYGWSTATALGQQANQLLQEDEDQLTSILAVLLEQSEWRGEMQKATQAGERRIVESRWTLVRNEQGQPNYVLNVDTDITDKKNLENQFYQSQKFESLGRLASGIAHDLNNVFTPILTMAQVLRLKQKQLDSQTQESLQLLESSAKRGTKMVKHILTLIRGGTGDRVRVDPAAILTEVVAIAQESFPKAIEVSCESLPLQQTETLPFKVLGDPTQLHQIFMNLCINARDAMPDGGRLTLSLQQVVLDAADAQKELDAHVGPYVVITVSDTGTGIDPNVRDRIFDPFFTTKKPGEGTGLGLATVLSIVKNSGGFLQVHSEVGQGSTFKVYLPAIEAAADIRQPLESVPPDPSSKSFNGNGELILVVDDDQAVRLTTQVLLENQRYKTLTAQGGAEAIALFTDYQAQIRLVILDMMMPQMSGSELIQQLRSLDSAVPILAISGLPPKQALALAAGANAFLLKPYSISALLGQVANLLAYIKSG